MAYIPKKDMREKVANDIRTIFNAPDLTEAKRFLEITVEKYKKSASRLSEWLELNINSSGPHQKTKRSEWINQAKNGRGPLGGTNFFLDLSVNEVTNFGGWRTILVE